MARFCVNCGSSLTDNSNFCNICGTRQPPIPAPEKKAGSTPRQYYPPPPQARKHGMAYKLGIAIAIFAILGIIGGLIDPSNNGSGSSQSGSQARFAISGFAVTPNEIIMGDSFDITLTVSNTGGSQGTYPLNIRVNDVQISSQSIRLSPNKAETISVQYTASEYGEYEVEVGDKSETVLAVIHINVFELRAEYEENEVAADEKFEDKIIYVNGVIDNIGKDVLDTPYITLDDGTIINSVQCMFEKTDESIVADLKMGQEVTVRGECAGEIIFGNILLRGSSIIN